MGSYLSIISGAMLLLLTACSSSPPKKPDTIQRGDYSYLKTYLTWLIDKEMAKQDVEGLSIAVVDDQKVVWSQGFGYADTANKVAATPATIYRVGSISKLFTDTLVMQLAEQGKLDIDKPLNTYLPEFSIKSRFPEAGAITPRNIMTHHSGLPGDVRHGMWTKNPAPFGQLVDQLKDDYVAYPPNTIFAYSNLGITLLGAMLEQVTGKSFNAYAEQQLLMPLGMKNAMFSSALKDEFVSKAYKNHEEKAEMPLRDTPAGGLSANVLDMSRFIKMVLADGKANGQQILKPETLKEMLSQQNKGVALDISIQNGLGWFLSNSLNTGMIAEHGGSTFYHNSLLNLSPEHKLGVVTLANSLPNGDFLEKINDAALKLAFEIKTGKQPIEAVAPKVATRALTATELEKFAGQYASVYGFVNLTKHGDTLETDIGDKHLELIAREDGRYDMRYKLMGLIPLQPEELKNASLSLKNISGHDLVLFHKLNETYVFGEKIKPVPISASWKNRLGEYEIINLAQGEAFLPEKCTLRERDGFLALEYSVPIFEENVQPTPIEPISDSEAIILGMGRSSRETIRIVKTNGKELLAYSGYLLQKK